ncbi:hypothetical protein JTB14_037207 [Gonioctena quinquepunctata]|nr:hypothetical protein JTB14_037207 [Gonioctena quinquepunctata]
MIILSTWQPCRSQYFSNTWFSIVNIKMNESSTSLLSTFATTAAPILPKLTERFFSWYDYGIFSTMLALSGAMGIYFGCCGKKQTTTDDYLYGGKQMKVFPIVVSLIASHSSGVSLLALPAEIYLFGAAYWLCGFSFFLVALITNYIFLPVFYTLQLTSTYEYIELRYDKRSRKLASILFAVSVFFHLPIVIYVPALAFSSATGIDVHYITPVVCGICVFYTTIGGLKALVWTDTLQFNLTMLAISVIAFLGFRASGGIANVFATAAAGQRLDIWNFELDFFARDPFWTIFIGLTIHFVGHTSISQGCIQKFLAVATLKDSNKTVSFYCLGMTIVKTLCVISGFNIYARYAHCDPVATKQITSNDEIFPFYVLDVGGKVPGLAGLFIAGVFCASLSALSTNLNCLAGTIYEDFLKRIFEKKGYSNASFSLKILVVIIGVISTLMVYFVEHFGSLLSLAIGLTSVAYGPSLGMFTMGVLFPRANRMGAFYGSITSLLCMSLLIIGNSYYKMMGLLGYPKKPLSVDGCEIPGNFSIKSQSHDVYVIPIFRISFYWFTLIGTIICMTVGLIISYMSKEQEPPVARELLSPVIYGLIDAEKYKNRLNLDYTDVVEPLTMNEDVNKGRRPSRWEALREERMRKLSKLSVLSDAIDN